MRIAHFIDTNVMGGAETLIYRLCEETIKRGDEPLLIHFDHDKLAKVTGELGVPEIRLEKEPLFKSTYKLPLFASYLRGLLKKEGVDVLHSHLFGPVCAGGLTALANSSLKGIGTLHDVYVLEESWTRCKALGLSCQGSNRLVTVAKFIENYVKENAFPPIPNILTIPNGTAEAEEYTREELQALRKSFQFKETDLVVMTAGRLVELKGHWRLIEAWKKLVDYPSIKLLICGDGPLRSSLEQAVKESGLERQVIFAGFRKDISKLLSASDCFTLSSDTEGLSCSITEAMMHGLPITCTDVGGNSELVENNSNGWLFDKDQPQELAEQLLKLFKKPSLLENLGNHSRELAETKYSMKAMSDAYWELYSE